MSLLSKLLAGPHRFVMRLACRVNRHEPRGFRADWDGTHYVSKCEYCSVPIRRMAPGKWLRDLTPRKKKRLHPAE